jgi:mRNA interferase MazF
MKQRGDISWINFDPSVGQEIKKKRPAIIVSNNMSNKYLKRFQVIPVSSNVE